jgi:ATP-dependent DNA helicase RecG
VDYRSRLSASHSTSLIAKRVRPEKYLGEYTQTVLSLSGVGPKTAALLERMDIHSLCDLLLYFPRDYLDRSSIAGLSDALVHERGTYHVTIGCHQWMRRGRKRLLKIAIEDRTGQAFLLCYGRDYLARLLTPGKRAYVSGKFSLRYRELQTANFEIEIEEAEGHTFEPILPLYPLTAGIRQNALRRMVRAALAFAENMLGEELPLSLRQKHRLMALPQSLSQIHFPEDRRKLTGARKYFIYWDLFYLQLVMKRRALERKGTPREPRKSSHSLKEALLSRLPFTLTEGQGKAVEEIERDLFGDHPMSRLLQGEVGSGKTLVAFVSALSIIGAGEQVALMAPTELLARQHADRAVKLLEPIGVRVGLLTGSLKPAARRLLLNALESGDIQLLVGTHALFSDDVSYHALGLVVVDEQHRFGVRQRLSLVGKGLRAAGVRASRGTAHRCIGWRDAGCEGMVPGPSAHDGNADSSISGPDSLR